MENSDVFGSSTAPLTWHDFLERMRHPSAADFVKAIKSFIVSFLNNAPDAERDSVAVQEFLGNMEAAFRAHPLWAGSSEEELESAGEGLEKYVMTKLFTRVFASIPEDVKADEQLYEKMALIQQFIRPENLDIKPTFQNETSWLANPPQLHSNLSYIQRFRRQTRLVAEAAYFFTNMLSVESFMTNIDAKALSMDEVEFERNMESAQALLSGLSQSTDNSYSQMDQHFGHVPSTEPVEAKSASNPRKQQRATTRPQSPLESSQPKSRNEGFDGKDHLSLDKPPSISDLENKGAAELLKEEEVNQLFRDFPYLYSQAGDLTVGDVEDLLSNYKQLVFKYVCLAKGMGVSPPSLSSSNTHYEQTEVANDSEEIKETNPNDDTRKDISSTNAHKSIEGLLLGL
ncbi:UNVERIFIED_CONTAM: Vacuolar protein sorting-associated protein 9A [Sesamum calycinum]|uniref:Vacuolar protein sorting-associated protein 9A n=1 Tax=Sesamum calycinum TaxID=2727403 RepID=A0AAW2QNU5_9LAMI